VLLDSSVLVDHLRSFEPATEYMAALEERPVCSEISRIEILQSLRSPKHAAAEKLFALIEWIAVDEQISRRAGELGRRWRRTHTGLGVADLAVAATVLQLGAQLATRNVKHFPMFGNLAAPY
jgi:predicted nucleic acid-binding protein